MNALDVISLQQAKDFIKVEFSDDDALITGIISSAVALVEQKTQYRLYQRVEVEGSDGTYDVDLFQTPLNSVTVTTFEGTPVTWCVIKREPVRTSILFKINAFYNRGGFGWPDFNNGGFGSGRDNGVINFPFPVSLPYYNITIDCGYTDTTKIPLALTQACEILITYMYENRDMALQDLPGNVNLLLEPYNRAPLF